MFTKISMSLTSVDLTKYVQFSKEVNVTVVLNTYSIFVMRFPNYIYLVLHQEVKYF